jgi:hypothetical protein
MRRSSSQQLFLHLATLPVQLKVSVLLFWIWVFESCVPKITTAYEKWLITLYTTPEPPLPSIRSSEKLPVMSFRCCNGMSCGLELWSGSMLTRWFVMEVPSSTLIGDPAGAATGAVVGRPGWLVSTMLRKIDWYIWPRRNLPMRPTAYSSWISEKSDNVSESSMRQLVQVTKRNNKAS